MQQVTIILLADGALSKVGSEVYIYAEAKILGNIFMAYNAKIESNALGFSTRVVNQ